MSYKAALIKALVVIHGFRLHHYRESRTTMAFKTLSNRASLWWYRV